MTATTPEISEDAIAAYLLATPDFFHRHAQLLAKVQLTHPHSGRAISLADRQLELQRERFKALELKQSNLLRLGKENLALAGKLHQWMLALLAQANSSDTLEAEQQLCHALQSIFDIPQATVDNSKAAQAVAARMTVPVCGLALDDFFVINQTTATLPDASQAASLALIPLPAVGLLILASGDPDRFTADMGTEFLTRLGELAQATLFASSHVSAAR